MAKLTLELFRTDFNTNHWENYEKGYSKLSHVGLDKNLLYLFTKSDDVFITLGEDKHFLKQRNKQ